jgi:phage tail-like protein
MTTPTSSRLFDYLPAIYREGEGGALDALLGAFESVLLGSADAAADGSGLEQIIAGLASHFDPQLAPEPFLPWLAGWVAFAVGSDLDPDQKRYLLGRIVSYYPYRGTPKGLQSLLELFTFNIGRAVVMDWEPDAQLGVHSTLGKDFYLEGGPPYSFTVTLYLRGTPVERARQTKVASALIEAEKPAHTVYQLIQVAKGMLLGKAQLGVDTILGTLAPH